MKLIQHISLLCCVGLLASLGSCTTEAVPDVKSYTAEEVGGDVNLSLNVNIGNTTGVGQSRAEEEAEIDKNFTVEQTDIPEELINTLRVIIVRPDNTVEFNRLITPTDKLPKVILNADSVEQDELKFRVSTTQGYVDNKAMTCTERKRIYLIANEATLDNYNISFLGDGQKITDYLKGITPAYTPTKEDQEKGEKGKLGDKLDPYVVERWIIYNDWKESGDSDSDVNNLLAEPIIDNSGTEKSYIPMTEFFDVDVVSSWAPAKDESGEGDSNQNGNNASEDKGTQEVQLSEQKVELFVTRNFVKFQFTASSETEKFEIVSLRFGNLMQQEYLFPCNTLYDPIKTVNNPVDRQIISFLTPGSAGNFIRPYVFEFPEGMTFTPPTEEDPKVKPISFSPMLYFCETHNYIANTNNTSKYELGAVIRYHKHDGTTVETTYEPQGLENLPYSLPRNTIVRINITIHDHKLAAEATVYPYTAVNLNPQFGFPKPDTDMLTVAPEMVLELNGKDGLLYPNFESKSGNTIQNLYWVSSDSKVVSLGNEVTDETDMTYIKPSGSIELPYLKEVMDKQEPNPVRLVAMGVGTATVTAYTQSGLVARCRVTVK